MGWYYISCMLCERNVIPQTESFRCAKCETKTNRGTTYLNYCKNIDFVEGIPHDLEKKKDFSTLFE